MPAKGWRSPNRKGIHLHVPLSDETAAKIIKLAGVMNTTKTDAARELIERGLRELEKGKIL